MENQNISQILAIMVTDIVGYTQTMNEDDNKAWEYIKKQRDIIPSIVSQMNGYMFKEMGDGTYSKFKSAIDAVQCAVRINNEAVRQGLPIKIGVHLGEVKDDGKDVIGTGVNIADRINSLATANKIIISDDIWRQIRSQADMEAASMGKKELKGYHESVEVFELMHNPDGSLTKKVKVTETVTFTDEEGKKVQAESAKKEFIKKIALFPFDNSTDNQSIDYIAYGFPYGCCISLLGDPLVDIQFPNKDELHAQTFFYKLNQFSIEKGMHVPQPLKKKIAKELHCDYFVSGSLNFISDNFEFSIKLYSVNNGKIISENSFQGSDYFTLIDECSLYLRESMGIPRSHIDEIDNLPFCEIVTESVDVYKKYIDGIIIREYENNYIKACKLFKEAATSDPTCSLANYALFWSGFLSTDEALKKDGDKAINAAISHLYKLPPRFSFLIKYHNFWFNKGDMDKSKKVLEMWIKQYPQSIDGYYFLGDYYSRQMKHDKAIDTFKKILKIVPEYYVGYSYIAFQYRQLKDYDNSLLYAKKYLECYPSEAGAYAVVARAYYAKCDYNSAKDFYEEALMLETDKIEYLTQIAHQDINLGNFTEAREQLDDAIISCKTDEDFYEVYDFYRGLCLIEGKIKDSIKYSNMHMDYHSKIMNPLDHSIMKMITATETYPLINEEQQTKKIIEDEVKKTSKPFNLIGEAIGLLFSSTFNENKKDIESGINKFKEFKESNNIAFSDMFISYGIGLLHMIDKKYDKAIELFISLKEKWNHIDVLLCLIVKCYNRSKNYKEGIKVAEDYLEKSPYTPNLILEVTKSYIGISDLDKANKYLTKLLSIWSDADEEYILFQEAKKLWKDVNQK